VAKSGIYQYTRGMSLRNLAHGLSTCLAVALLTVACAQKSPSGSPTPTPSGPSTDVGFSAPLASACAALPAQTPLAEVKGSRLWALVFAPLPIKARTDTKIVWRMGGHGAFHIEAKTTDGTGAQLTFGPEAHGGSTWYVPNTDEWGTGFIFPSAGCWRVHAWRDGSTGDVFFNIVEP
jgi:hypothetical protein